MWGDGASKRLFGEHLSDRLHALVDSLGSAAVFGLVSFAAILIGSFVINTLLGAVVVKLMSRSSGPDWANYIKVARDDLRFYEEYPVELPGFGERVSNGNKRFHVASMHYGKYLAEEVDIRVRQQSEVEFRLYLALVSLAPLLALAWTVRGLAIVLAIGATALVVTDSWLMSARVESQMLSREIARVENRIEDLSRSVAGMLKTEQNESVAASYTKQREGQERDLEEARRYHAALKSPSRRKRRQTLAQLQPEPHHLMRGGPRPGQP